MIILFFNKLPYSLRSVVAYYINCWIGGGRNLVWFLIHSIVDKGKIWTRIKSVCIYKSITLSVNCKKDWRVSIHSHFSAHDHVCIFRFECNFRIDVPFPCAGYASTAWICSCCYCLHGGGAAFPLAFRRKATYGCTGDFVFRFDRLLDTIIIHVNKLLKIAPYKIQIIELNLLLVHCWALNMKFTWVNELCS